ncbi:hypothetical protein AAVH_33375, partial [Aphelenchoides avenae]
LRRVLQSNLPFFAYSRRRNTMFLTNGDEVSHAEMRCENVYRTCSEQSALIAVKEEGDEDCIWCARNGTLGYSIAYKERARCEGHIILDTCPPIITKVTRDGPTYFIDGKSLHNFASVSDKNTVVGPSIHACGDVCEIRNTSAITVNG